MPMTSLSLPEAFLEALLNSPLGIAVIDREMRYTHVNPALAQMNSSVPRAFIGQTVREVVPHLAAILEPALRQVIRTGTARHDLEVFGDGPDAGRVWSEHLLPLRDADGKVSGVIVTVEEITAHRELQQRSRTASERAAFQLRLSDALRPLTDPLEAQRVATALLQTQLAADRVFYAEVEPDLQHVIIALDEGQLEPRIVGRHLMSSFGPTLVAELHAGRTLAIEDFEIDARLEPRDHLAHQACGVRATFAQPLMKCGRLVGTLVAQSVATRVWTPEEKLLITDTTERLWEALERARTNATLRTSEARLREILDRLPLQIWLSSASGEVQYLNKHWYDYSGTTPAETTAARVAEESVHPDDVPGLMAAFAQAMSEGHPFEVEQRNRDASGEWRWFSNRAEPLRDPTTGAVTGWVGAGTDIHERKLLHASLEASNARQAFLLRLGDALRGLDSAEEIQLSAARLLGEHLGASRAGYAQDLGDGENVEITSDYSVPGVASLRGRYRYEDYGSVLLREFRAGRTVVRPDIANDPNLSTQERDAHARISVGASLNVPMFKNGRLVAVFFINHPSAHSWTFEEVTLAAQTAERTLEAAQRARVEAELRASNEQFTRTIEDAPVPILLQAEDGEVLRVNRAWTELTGYAHGDLPTMDAWLTHACGQGSEALRDRMRALFAGETAVVESECEIVTRTLDRRTWLWSASSPGHLRDGRRFAVAMATDITERKASELRLQRNAETFEHLVQTAPFGIYVIDADFRFAHVSAGALPSFDSVSPLLGRDFTEVIHTIWTEPFASEIISRFRHTLQTGESYVAASTERRGDVAAVESYDWRIDRVTLPDGRYGVVCYFRDVTNARLATQRLEEINAAQRQFVSDAAHELRAPLTSILGNLSLLRRFPDVSSEERAEMLTDAERETTRLTRLIADLLSVARGEARIETEPERVALERLLEGAWRGALSLSEHKRFDLGRLEPLVVLGDPDALKQLFLILFENAVKYSPTNGAVRLEASECEGWAEVRVHNDGAGIAPEDLERVFERFYRTDRARSRSGGAMGTGLGLTIARQIVERHGGRVWFESAEGRGTTAVVRLPRQASASMDVVKTA